MNEANPASAPAAAAPQTLSAAVAHAEQCDAAGKHVEAVNYLAAGARGKDVEALTRLGKRLLVGDRAPLLTNDGARLLAGRRARRGRSRGGACRAVCRRR
ncbi:MAG: hypothetical protein EHM50_01445 [Lysobacterales bacterium]|nr:MAG: hypothetical protein EHM50_01445 [Xanthomonadales bacterium]